AGVVADSILDSRLPSGLDDIDKELVVDALSSLSALRGKTAECVYDRSEEHTSELQSLAYLVCRLLLEKKKNKKKKQNDIITKSYTFTHPRPLAPTLRVLSTHARR